LGGAFSAAAEKGAELEMGSQPAAGCVGLEGRLGRIGELEEKGRISSRTVGQARRGFAALASLCRGDELAKGSLSR
jgi:hypothetical protein